MKFTFVIKGMFHESRKGCMTDTVCDLENTIDDIRNDINEHRQMVASDGMSIVSEHAEDLNGLGGFDELLNGYFRNHEFTEDDLCNLHSLAKLYKQHDECLYAIYHLLNTLGNAEYKNPFRLLEIPTIVFNDMMVNWLRVYEDRLDYAEQYASRIHHLSQTSSLSRFINWDDYADHLLQSITYYESEETANLYTFAKC